MRHYKIKLDRIMFDNRWSRPIWNRSDNWTIVGIHVHHFNSSEFEYHLCFFGFRVRIWMIKVPIQESNQGQPPQESEQP